jgi:hypothetical protein
MSGAAGKRRSAVTAKPLMRPARTCGSVVTGVSMIISN